jgi:hypothetical protein
MARDFARDYASTGKKDYTLDDLTAVAQIVVSLVEPVGAGRSEDVEIEGILERPGFMRHVRGDAKNFAGAHDDLLAINGKFQCALEDIG